MKSKAYIAITITGLILSTQAQAQQTPDAGSLLREQPKTTPLPSTPAIPSRPVESAPQGQETGPKVLVKGFRIIGARQIPELELQAQLQSAIGHEFSFKQLQATTTILINYYMQKGYLARVILPPQDIKDGIVTLQVIEGKRGSLKIDNKGERLDAERVGRMIDQRLAAGESMDLTALGEALNILNEQPGVSARSSLVPGQGEGDIDLVVTAADRPLLSYGLGANNHGSRGTGEAQLTASLGLNNPSGNFDAASLLLNAAEGSTYGRADYSIAVGDRGLRLGVNVSSLNYHLTQSSFSALRAHGTAQTAGLMASYPLVRRQDLSLGLSGNYDQKLLKDYTVSGETGNRHVKVLNLGLNGYTQNSPDSLLGGSITSFGGNLVLGNSDQRNAGALSSDQSTRRAQGDFSKISYNFAHLRPINDSWSLNLSLRGQFADKNLDSSERFSLGGPTGVRAYPVGEATGDEGWLASFNLNRRLSDAVGATLFVDTGSIRLNRKLWNNWNSGTPRLENRYELSGIGVGFDWKISPLAVMNFSLANPLGSNPGRDSSNHNADGSNSNGTRGWLGLNAQF